MLTQRLSDGADEAILARAPRCLDRGTPTPSGHWIAVPDDRMAEDMKALSHPSVWRGEELSASVGWDIPCVPAEHAELEHALRTTEGVVLEQLAWQDLSLPASNSYSNSYFIASS